MDYEFRVVCRNINRAELVREELEKVNAELVLKSIRNSSEMIEDVQDADALMYQGGIHIDDDVISQFPNKLRTICSIGTGYDFIDPKVATEHGILLLNIVNVFHKEVALHAMTLMLASARQLVPVTNAIHDGGWRRPKAKEIPRFHGQTLGLVAFGRIAQSVAKMASGFDMRILAYDPYVEKSVAQEYGVSLVELDTLLKESDFVSCHAPLTEETYHMIGEGQFKLMRQSAYFVNTGRGKLVDESALIEALNEGWIAGAGLDVMEKEPLEADNPLRKMENVVLTPHMASLSYKALIERRRKLGRQVAIVLAGKLPEDGVVNPEVSPAF